MLIPAALFLTAWAVFTAGAAPSLYGGDAGEFVASAVTLGVSHAPGYPLHALLGKLFTAAVPFGGPAFRVNSLSVFAAAAGTAGLFVFLRRQFNSLLPALAGSLLYAALPLVWDQAQTAEVFALNNLMAVGVLLAWQAERWGAAAFLAGLSVGNHHTVALLAPGLFLTFFRKPAALARAPFWTACFLLGFSVMLFLPLRAARHPPVNFGDPHTPARFWDVLTRKEFGSLELHPTSLPVRSAETMAQGGRAFARLNARVIGATATLAGLAGILLMTRGRGGFGTGAWPMLWLLTGPAFYVFSNLSPFNTLAQWRLERFLLLPALFLCVGVAGLIGRLWTGKGKLAACLLLAGLAAEQAVLERPWFRWNLAFRDFGRNVAANLPPDALLLIDRVLFDEPTSAWMNARLVERARPDVRTIYRPGTLFELFYGEDILEIPREARMARQAEREKILWAGLDRPLAAMAFVKENLPPFAFRLDGLLYRREGKSVRPASVETVFLRRELFASPARDYPTRLIQAHAPYFAAKGAFERKDAAAATAWAAKASAAGADMEWLQSNIGALWSRSPFPDALPRARAAFAKTAAIDPWFAEGHFGLGYAAFQEGDRAAAAASFARAARCRPSWAEAYYMEGVAHRLDGRASAARAAWEKFLALDPSSPLAASVREELAGPR